MVKMVSNIKDRQEICHFCGEPEHKAYWGCPRIRSVSMDGDCWSVEFWEPDDGEIEFVSDMPLRKPPEGD